MFTVDRVAFTIFGQNIYWYGIIIGAGTLLAAISAWIRSRRYNLPKDIVIDLLLVAIPVGLIAARLYYVIFSWDNYSGDLMRVFNFRDGGIAIWGGIIGGAAAVWVVTKVKKVSFLHVTDLLAPSLALAQGIGRWGNFFNQEAYGIAVTNPAFQFFPAAVYIESEAGWFAATFFYESIWCVFIYFLLTALDKRRRFKATGDIFLFYLMLYGFERSIVEGLRLDSLYIGTARVSQLLSLALLWACAVIVLIRYIRGVRRLNLPAVISGLALIAALFLTPALIGGMAPTWMVAPAAVLILLSTAYLYIKLPFARVTLTKKTKPEVSR